MAKAGRPKGTGYKDGPYLDRIADALTCGSSKTPNAAIMKIAKRELQPNSHEAFRRRMHDKWKVQGKERMAAARDRHAERTRKTNCDAGKCVAARGRVMQESIAQIVNPLAKQMREIQGSGVFGQIARGLDTGVFAHMRDLQHSGVFAQMRELQHSGVFAQMRELEKSSLSAVMRDLEHSNILGKFETK